MLAVGVGGGVGEDIGVEKGVYPFPGSSSQVSSHQYIDIFLGQAITACFVGDATSNFQAFYSVSGAWAHVDPFW